MVQLLDIFEKYTSGNTALLRYMKERPLDVYNYWNRESQNWADSDGWVESYMGELYPNGIPPEMPPDLPTELVDSFDHYIRNDVIPNDMINDPTEAPTWEFMDLNKQQLLKPTTWLVHFSDHAQDIARNGFTIGIDQMDRLGLTTYFANSGDSKIYGGYNFAFSASDSRDIMGGKKYGSDIVMFQNSGVEVDHHGDDETQIIFKGEDVDPRGIVWITNNHGDWSVMPHPLSNRDRPVVQFDDSLAAIKWVQTNYNQYRKIITGY